MKKPLLFAALLATTLSSVSAKAAEAPDRAFSFRVAVDAAGKVTEATPHGEIPAPLLPMLQDVANRAAFEPATVNGKPVPSRTSINVMVRMQPDGNRYRAEVVDVLAGGGWQMRAAPPRYPVAAIQAGYGAYVWSYVSYGADGRVDVAKSRVESVHLANGNGGQPKARRIASLEPQFRAAVEQALAQWTYTPDEVDGKPIASAVRVPTTFCPPQARKGCNELWSDEIRSAAPPAVPQDEAVKLPTFKPAADSDA